MHSHQDKWMTLRLAQLRKFDSHNDPPYSFHNLVRSSLKVYCIGCSRVEVLLIVSAFVVKVGEEELIGGRGQAASE